jgi:hypothetical protein
MRKYDHLNFFYSTQLILKLRSCHMVIKCDSQKPYFLRDTYKQKTKCANSPSCRYTPYPFGTPSAMIVSRVSSTATGPAKTSSTWWPADARSCSRRHLVGVRGRRRAAGTYRVSTGMCSPRRTDRKATSRHRPPTEE